MINIDKSKWLKKKIVIALIFLLTITNFIFGQSTSIKDSDKNTLISIIDEGEFGVLMIPPWESGDSPQTPIDNKLYNRNGNLYWGANWLALSSSSGWTDDGAIVRLRSGADNVGIGTITPTEKLDINGNLNFTGILKIDGFSFLSNLGDYNIFVGQEAGLVNTGSRNTFAGHQTGYSNVGATRNTFVGDQSGYNTTSGQMNTFYGHYSGHNHLTELYNTYIGYKAGFSGNNIENTFVGSNAGVNCTSGDYNTFIGSAAGGNNTSGSANLFCGRYAGFSNHNGQKSTYIGAEAGRNNSDGDHNTFIGYNSGYSSSYDGHIFIGFESGKNETGSNKLYIENSDSATPLIGGSFSSDEIYLNGKVGIGTDTPDEKFEVEFGNENIDFEVGQGTTSTSTTFLAVRNPDGTKYYIYVNGSGSITTSTSKP